MKHTHVTFETADSQLQKLFQLAESKAKENLRNFNGRTVLVEGGGYDCIWPETQPMGGEMYAKRNMEAALNNQLLFLDYQREDGRFPGHIRCENGQILPFYHHIQGCCFPSHARNLYYWMGQADKNYLRRLYHAFSRFDSYLWTYRDSDGDGCLESWCIWDTGEDSASRFQGGQDWFCGENPPHNDPVFPVESPDFMGISFDLRRTLAELSVLLDNGRQFFWRDQAEQIRRKIRGYLWDETVGACLERDRQNRPCRYIGHNNIKLMYHGAMYPGMAARFVQEHLLNPEEFLTPMPLPSCAANGPYFINEKRNNWSGQPEGLTYQRAIAAMENYGFLSLQTFLGNKLIEAVSRHMTFAQQFDPFTGEPSEPERRSTYGPTILAVLEYLSRLYGIHMQYGKIFWGAYGGDSKYTQEWGEHCYSIHNENGTALGFLDGTELFRTSAGVRITTGLHGENLTVTNITSNPQSITLRSRERTCTVQLVPDQTAELF